uniref:Transmembrane protein n=1 Tax=Cajanus cajan TaxID=3821 RepID=A0A151QQ77_CAJCA|nr:hypothetical protein KK1_046868 [Cajanus cajan]
MKVKKVWLAVEVEEGGGSERFMILIWYLYHLLFKHLLDKAYEVYGYHTQGPLTLSYITFYFLLFVCLCLCIFYCRGLD